MLVAALGGVGAQRIDRDDVRARARCAASTKRHWWRFVESRFAPHRMSSFRVRQVLGVHAHGAAVGGPQRGPRRRCRSWSGRRLAPSAPNSARPARQLCTSPIGAGEEVRQHRLGAVRPTARASPPRWGRAPRPRIPSNGPRPWRRAAQRLHDRPGSRTGVEVAVDLPAQRPPREGVVALAAQFDGAPVLDVDQPGARVRAVQGTAAANDGSHAAESTAGRRRFRSGRDTCAGEDLNLHDPKGH